MDAAWRPSATLATLRARARMLAATRAFFAARAVLEVEVPLLQGGPNLDRHVEPLAASIGGDRRWCITSPEHPLKRLVAAGYGDLWSLSPCVRCGEQGRQHAPEFRMLEWYRQGWDAARLATECLELLAQLTGLGPAVEQLTYREAFQRSLDLDPFTCSSDALRAVLPAELRNDMGDDRDDLLEAVLGLLIQPRLPGDRWTVIHAWPPSQAAQARLTRDLDGTAVAARFEIYRGPLELANGYHECVAHEEIRARLSAEAATRATASPLDERYLAALAHGLPDCAGVAVGFDRVVMLALGLDSLGESQAFDWDRA